MITAAWALWASCPAPGWCPGVPVATPSSDPSTTPDPASVVGGLVPALKTALLGSGGAAILVAAGLVALVKGLEVLLGMIKRKRSPEQLTLF